MAFNSRQSNMFRGSQQNSGMKTPGSVMKKKQQTQKSQEHDIFLKDNEIIECLQELNMAFQLEDLRKPLPAKVQYLFEFIAGMLMGVRKESVEPMVRAAGEQQDYPEGMYEAALLMSFVRSLTQLMTECNVHDFCFNDLLKPEPDRLRFLLSNLINFLRFRGERWELMSGYFLKGEQAKERIEQLYHENEELQRRLETVKEQRRIDEPVIRESEQQNRKLTEELRNLKKQQTVLQNELDKVKSERKSLITTLEDRHHTIEVAQRECNKLAPYIVDSPEKLTQVITDLGISLNSERAAVDSAERQVRALQTSADSFAIVEQDVTSCIKLMEDCERELIKEEECTRKSQRHEEIFHQKEAECRELDRKENRLERMLENAKEKLAKAREQANVKRESAKKEMQKLKDEYERLSQERDTTNKDNDKKIVKIERKQKEMADLKERIEEEIRAAQIEYERLCSHIELYISEMNQCIHHSHPS